MSDDPPDRRREVTTPLAPLPSQTESQHEVITWLDSPASHGLGQHKIDRVETHTSIVFLTGERAYKLKRAGRHQDLDYSTPELRRAACVQEVRRNRRSAPRLYGRVRAVTRSADGSLALDGAGQELDWVVEMQRFPGEGRFDLLAERGGLELGLMTGLADAVAHLHGLAEWHFDHGGVDGMTRVIQSHHAGLRRDAQPLVNAALCERVIERAFDLMHASAERLESRRSAGFVREGHGDLRLRNVCLFQEEPTLFDCGELGVTACCSDVMYDLSSLLVDLLDRGLDRHANVVLNRYFERTDDHEGLALLPLFLSSQATALVVARAGEMKARATDGGADGAGLRDGLSRAMRLSEGGHPQVVVVAGATGVGKTTLAERLAPATGPAPGALVLQDERERRHLMGLAPGSPLGANAYSAGLTRQAYRKLAERAERILAEGHAVVVDAACADPVERAMLVDVAARHNAPFTGLWLDAPLETRRARRGRRGDDISNAGPSLLGPDGPETPPPSWSRIDAAGDEESVWRAAGLESVAREPEDPR